MTTDEAHYYDLRNRVYDKIDVWEKLGPNDSEVQLFFKVIGTPIHRYLINTNPIVKQHFQALDGPYGETLLKVYAAEHGWKLQNQNKWKYNE